MRRERFTKRYATPQECAEARFHYDWLVGYAQPLVLPRLLTTGSRHMEFEYVHGRHATPGDLEALATHLGDAHGAAWVATLHTAQLDTPHLANDGHAIPDFVTPRLAALSDRGRSSPPQASKIAGAIDLLQATADDPAAFYKDTNPRNVLITRTGRMVTVDFDDLTLAPFGYDLAKLVVTLSMTYGRLPAPLISRALDAYNTAAARHAPHLGHTSHATLLGFAEIHDVLTAPYLGRGGYRYRWPVVCPHRHEGCVSEHHH